MAKRRVSSTAAPAPSAAFPEALVAARRYAGFDQRALASTLRLSVRTMTRWERGRAYPTPEVRPRVIAWARALPPDVGGPVLVALGIMVVTPAAIAAPAPATSAAPALVDAALAAMSEQLDVGPRSLRRALDRFLAALVDGGVAIDGARRRLQALDEPDGARAAKKR